MLHDEHPVRRRERGHLVAPVARISGVAVDEHQRLAPLAVQLEVDPDLTEHRDGHALAARPQAGEALRSTRHAPHATAPKSAERETRDGQRADGRRPER